MKISIPKTKKPDLTRSNLRLIWRVFWEHAKKYPLSVGIIFLASFAFFSYQVYFSMILLIAPWISPLSSGMTAHRKEPLCARNIKKKAKAAWAANGFPLKARGFIFP